MTDAVWILVTIIALTLTALISGCGDAEFAVDNRGEWVVCAAEVRERGETCV